MKHRQAGATLFVTSALLLSSTLVRAEDLVDVYRLAQENDAVYQSAKYRYDSTLESRVQARAAFLPQLDASGSTGLNDFNDDRNETFNSTTLSLSLNQSLFNRRNQIRARQADLGIAEAQASLTASEQDLLLRSAQAYFGVLSASDNLQFAQSEKKAIEQQLEQAERRFEVGLIAVTDVTEFSRLNSETPLIAPEPNDIEKWVETAETSNLTLRVAEYQAEIASQEIDSARSGHLPTLGAGATLSKVEQDGGAGDSETGTLAVQLAVPLYSGGLVSSQTRQAKSDAKLAAEQVELTRRNTAQQTRNAYRGVIAGISRVKALKQALQSTQIAAEATETGFEVGTRTAVDVLQSLRDTYQAQANYADARYDYILNTLALKQAAGILSLADLEAVNNWLEAQ